MTTRVVNIRTAGYDVYIGRAGHGQDGYFGNPFRLEAGQPRGTTIEKYRKYFYNRLETDPEFKRRIHELKDKTLGCFCKPYACHGDVIKEYLDGLPELPDDTHDPGQVEPFNRWWYSEGFDTMERVTGYRQFDFDPAEGYQAFVDACDGFWENLTEDERARIWEKYKL